MVINSINPGIPLTDLKMRKCRTCENIIVYQFEPQKFMPIYCDECHIRYRAMLGGYDN